MGEMKTEFNEEEMAAIAEEQAKAELKEKLMNATAAAMHGGIAAGPNRHERRKAAALARKGKGQNERTV